MSPAGNFTLHAILAACLAALAASSAAAGKPVIDNEGHAYLTIHLMGGNGAGNGQQLEIVSYQWGAAPSALKLDRNYVKNWSTSGDAAGSDPTSYGNWIADVERPAPKGGGQNELGMDDTAGKEKARQGHSMMARASSIDAATSAIRLRPVSASRCTHSAPARVLPNPRPAIINQTRQPVSSGSI